MGKFEQKMTDQPLDTIYALATPPGRSAIAVIRISGPKASKAPGIFSAACPIAGRFALARLSLDGRLIDQGLVIFMQGPRSSTGEDVCELHCHGSHAVITALLGGLATAHGFRMAGPGEFSRRSFMNGKMDLSAVEGLADLIDAETPKQLHQAWAQIDGALAAPVMQWRADLIGLAAQLEALIDFADEDLPAQIDADLRASTARLIYALSSVLDDGGAGELVRDGVKIAVVGPVNAGKSTILNALAGRAAAIVSDQAGTTRDIIQIRLDLGGVPATIMDTAGIRADAGPIESEGIKRALAAARSADLVMIVVDGSSSEWQVHMSEIDQLATGDMLTGKILIGDASNFINPDISKGSERLFVINKADLMSDSPKHSVGGTDISPFLTISAQNSADIDRLLAVLAARIMPLNRADGSIIITRVRHRDALMRARDALMRAIAHDFNYNPELAAEDFRLAASALGRITGEIDVEELLGSIFSAFCIGK